MFISLCLIMACAVTPTKMRLKAGPYRPKREVVKTNGIKRLVIVMAMPGKSRPRRRYLSWSLAIPVAVRNLLHKIRMQYPKQAATYNPNNLYKLP